MDGIAKELLKEAAESALRYGFSYVGSLVEQHLQEQSVPQAVLNSLTPIFAALAVKAVQGEAIDPETGKLSREVRMQFEAQVIRRLDESGLLKRF